MEKKGESLGDADKRAFEILKKELKKHIDLSLGFFNLNKYGSRNSISRDAL